MPQVPVYGGPQVAADPLRPVQARALDVSSGVRQLGQGLANLGEGIDRYQEREAQAQAFNAEATIGSDWLKWDAEARAKGRGENVGQYEADAKAWWDKAAETYGKDLNPRAKALIGRSLQQKRLAAEADVLRFAGAERERHADEVATADLNTTIQFGVTTGSIDATKAQIRDKVAAFGARKGWNTEQVQAASAEYISQLHMAQIDKLDAQAGLDYFTAHADEIEFDKQGDLRKALERQVEVEQKQRELEAKQAKADAEEAASNNAWAMVAQGATKIPPSLLASLPGREQVQIVNAIETRAQGREVKTDPALYNALALDIAEGKTVELRQHTANLKPTDMDRLLKMQQDMVSPEKQSSIATSAQMLGNYKSQLKTETNIQNFNRAALDEISRFEREKGRAPNYDERRKIMDDLLLEKIVEDGGFAYIDKSTPRYQLPADERITEMGAYEQFEVGRTYTDSAGIKAVYRGNGEWEEVK